MTRLLVKTPSLAREIELAPGCNRLGREGTNEILLPHPSVSGHHCEVWLTNEAVLVRDLNSRNGTYVNGARVEEAQVLPGQTLRVGDVEMTVLDAPATISVPDLPLPAPAPEQTFMENGAPCCRHHPGVEAVLRCTKCTHVFCSSCVRELRVAGGIPRSFCPDCGHNCERIVTVAVETKRGWLNRFVEVLTGKKG